MNPIDFLVDKMMLPILEKAFAVTGSYGWAIVFLTLIIRMVLLPLTMQSYYSMKAMQKIQPKLKKIQERYKNKPEELNKRMIALYRENKVNPLGGCLPLLVQMPFLFALYAALIGEKFKALLAQPEVSKAFFFMPDLARVGIYSDTGLHLDNLFLLAAFTLSTVVQQKTMTPAPSPDADPRQVAIQKQMAVMMPIMITVMFLIIPVPTGIYLYLVVSNLIGIGQYAFLNYHSARREALAAANSTSTHAAEDLLEDEDAAADEDEAVSVSVSGSDTDSEEKNADQKYRVKKSGKKKKKRK